MAERERGEGGGRKKEEGVRGGGRKRKAGETVEGQHERGSFYLYP